MKRALSFLSHPAWQGVGALSALAATCITIYLAIHPPTSVPQPSAPVQQREPFAPGLELGGATEDKYSDAREHLDEVISHNLGSVNSSYRGMHEYYNENPSLGVLAVILFAVGVIVLFAHHYEKRAKHAANG